MPVVPIQTNLFQSCKDLYQFLLTCQQKSIEKNSRQLVCISVEIDPVDPLAVLQEIAEPNQPHFYFEKRFEQEAIAAIHSTLTLETEGKSRFMQAQKFIHSCLESCIITDQSTLGNPRFFCSFTFFDQESNQNTLFPAATVFLPQWQIIRRGDRCVVVANLEIYPALNLAPFTEKVWQQFQTIQLAKYGIFNLSNELHQRLNQWQIREVHDFKSTVSSALKLIRTHQLDKLVLAHAIDVTAKLPFQWIHSLDQLRKLHPDCYVFSASSGRGQTFIGASPERLIRIHHHQLITDALAGSAPRGKTLVDDADLAHRLLTSQKERHEHQVVVDFISDRLQHLGLTPDRATVPTLLQLPNIQHLHTPIRATLPSTLHPLDILAELHPTPAVAGLPRNIACEQILQHEPFGRSLYAAPLGWLDPQGNAEFIVGIRSALIEANHARLYAGAGIVAGSDPAKELAEVKLKLQALLRALV